MGHLIGIGRLDNGLLAWPVRALLGLAGIALGLPGGDLVPLSNAALLVLAPALAFLQNRRLAETARVVAR